METRVDTPAGRGAGPLTVLVTVTLGAEAKRQVEEAVGADRVIFAPGKAGEAYIDEADIVFGTPWPEAVARAKRLRWLQVQSAGVDRYHVPEVINRPPFTLTNARGVYGVAGAEHVLGMMLMFNRGLIHFYRYQQDAVWNRDLNLARKLSGQTLGIVGLGDIGMHLARRAKAFGMRVLAVKRTPASPPSFVDALWTPKQLPMLLAESDHIALTVPLTHETRGMINADQLARMKPTAYLYNIGRGALVDEAALLRALEEGTIAGAGLDVFVEEPLPANHPLWRAPHVLITPHLGADSPWDFDEAARLFCENLQRFRAGETLRNIVDLKRGY